jgi:predicted CDP-diglyceride synthetase/phosphatidate cytidylyltransferase
MEYDESSGSRNLQVNAAANKAVNILVGGIILAAMIWAVMAALFVGQFDLAVTATAFSALGGLVGWRTKLVLAGSR